MQQTKLMIGQACCGLHVHSGYWQPAIQGLAGGVATRWGALQGRPTFGLVMMQDSSIPLEEGHHLAVLVPHSVHDGAAIIPATKRTPKTYHKCLSVGKRHRVCCMRSQLHSDASSNILVQIQNHEEFNPIATIGVQS